jgi:hypothetical protein
MKKTSLFPYGNSRTGKSGRRREETGRKSSEGTTEVGERVERGAVAMVGPIVRLRPE